MATVQKMSNPDKSESGKILDARAWVDWCDQKRLIAFKSGDAEACKATWAALLDARKALAALLPPSPPPVPTPSVDPARKRGAVFPSFMAEMFAGYVYVQDVHMMVTPDGHMLSQSQFDADERLAGREYSLVEAPVGNADRSDSAWDAFINCQFIVFPQVRGTRFDPREPEGAIIVKDGLKFVNIWRALDIRSVEGDVAPFLTHLKRILPNGDDALILLCYLATLVQHKGVKATWSIFLQGIPGNGKSLLGDKIMRYCLGDRYTHKARADKLGGEFNAAFYGKLLIQVDDIKVKSAVWEVLKPMITDSHMEIEPKGVDKVTREVCFNFIFTGNSKTGLRKTADDRRICPLFCAQQLPGDLQRDGLNDDYFNALHDWLDNEDGLAKVLHYLEHFPIDPRYNFAAGCIRAPRTTSTDDALKVGVEAVRQRIEEMVEADETSGMRGGWINWTAFKRLLDSDPDGRSMGPGERRDLLTQMGYTRHPGLNAGKSNAGQLDNPLPNGGGKPYLYIKAGHPDARWTGVRVAEKYLAAQAGLELRDDVPPPPPPRPAP